MIVMITVKKIKNKHVDFLKVLSELFKLNI